MKQADREVFWIIIGALTISFVLQLVVEFDPDFAPMRENQVLKSPEFL